MNRPAEDTLVPIRGASTAAYYTDYGSMHLSTFEDFAQSSAYSALKGKVRLVFTSPPFPLNRKKRYGNLGGDEYREWISSIAEPLVDLLSDDGSLVVEVGNGWERGSPEMSTLALRSLLELLDTGGLKLCQQFVCHNPARLPSPAQWVNIERIRVKDAFTHVWWMSKTARPYADNRNVLVPYSASMEKLLRSGKYNAGERPSQHNIGQTSFFTRHDGAIPSNVLTFANTRSSDGYRRYCQEHGLDIHPARMQPELADFFVKLCTEPDDIVFDPFAGSNTTGAAAESLWRQWVSVEPIEAYALGSRGRFSEGGEIEA